MLGLLLRRSDVRVVHLRRELEGCHCLAEMCLQWTDHHKHESLGVAPKRELEEVGQLGNIVSTEATVRPVA